MSSRYLEMAKIICLQDPSAVNSNMMANLGVNSGTVSMTWVKDAFAYAEGYDEVEQRYRGIRAMQLAGVTEDAQGLLVKSEAAQEQIERERVKPKDPPGSNEETGDDNNQPVPRGTTTGGDKDEGSASKASMPTRFYGTDTLDPTRVGRDAGRIAEEVNGALGGFSKPSSVVYYPGINEVVPGKLLLDLQKHIPCFLWPEMLTSIGTVGPECAVLA